MAKDDSFSQYILLDVLGHIDGITAKKMFSGYGIFLDGAIIAIIADGVLYFKADQKLKEKYLSLDCHPFTYNRNGKTVEMSYMSATEDMLENRECISERAYESYEISNKK